MSGGLCLEYVDIVRDVCREIHRNNDRGQIGIPLRQYLPVPRFYRNTFPEDRTWVLKLLQRALTRMVSDHILDETSPKPIIWRIHPDFDPKSIDVILPSAFNWLSACRTEVVLSQETLSHLELLAKFLRKHQGPPGFLALQIKILNDGPPAKKTAIEKRRSNVGLTGLDASQLKRQRPNGESSNATGIADMAQPSSFVPPPILPPPRQISYSKAVISHPPFGPSMATSSNDQSVLGRLLHLENIIKKQNTTVEGCYETVSELDDCLAELIARCTERKDQAKIVAQKVEKLENQMNKSQGFAEVKALVSSPIATGSSLIDAQTARISALEKLLVAAEMEKKAYQDEVAKRLRNLELRLEEVTKNSAVQQTQATGDILNDSTPRPNPRMEQVMVEASPFRSNKIAVEVRSAKGDRS